MASYNHEEQDADPIEPLWWGLFAAGGGITALCAPARILLQDVLAALGVPDATSSFERTT